MKQIKFTPDELTAMKLVLQEYQKAHPLFKSNEKWAADWLALSTAFRKILVNQEILNMSDDLWIKQIDPEEQADN